MSNVFKENQSQSIGKIGILTINDYNNYGNKLQNYATQEILISLGFSVETVVNNTKYDDKKYTIESNNTIIHRINKLINNPPKELYSKLNSKAWGYINKKKIEFIKVKRVQRFKDFTSQYLSETNYSITIDDIPNNLSEEYDFFITGSDQVWNPIFRQGSPIDFLTFAPKNKRIAYAPSFGIANIPTEYQERYKIWLMDMKSLSVRESTGAKIIKDLTGRDADVLVDPTLMLTKKEWLSISRQSLNKPSKPYMLTYFLGGVPNETKRKIKEIAQRNSLEIINLSDINDPNIYIADPTEFIDFINSASVLLTDSFHGGVFSILLGTPFIIFDRVGNISSMNSRIDTLLSTFKLESRFINNIKSNDEIFEVDYSHVPQILENERKKALNYLKDALEVRKPLEV